MVEPQVLSCSVWVQHIDTKLLNGAMTYVLIRTSGNTACMEEIDLNPTDHAILDRLKEGRASPSYIAGKEDYSRQNVTNRLTRLVELNYVEKLAPGLYELKKDPRTIET